VGFFQRALSEYGAAADSKNLAWQTARAGAALSEKGSDALALAFFMQALELYTELGDDQMTFHPTYPTSPAVSKVNKSLNLAHFDPLFWPTPWRYLAVPRGGGGRLGPHADGLSSRVPRRGPSEGEQTKSLSFSVAS
jgi:hypothetical protein